MAGPKREDLSGRVFGRIRLIRFTRVANNRYLYIGECRCGTVKEFCGSQVKHGYVKSCGCYLKDHNRRLMRRLKRQGIITPFVIHGMSYSPEYAVWAAMKARCHNSNLKCFPRYGGRGIRVCSRWQRSFVAFYQDMGKRPTGLSIDRINNDGNYTPSNCRWATRKEQMNNRGKSLKMRTLMIN